jgi:hypothetical protein
MVTLNRVDCSWEIDTSVKSVTCYVRVRRTPSEKVMMGWDMGRESCYTFVYICTSVGRGS